MSFFSDIEYMRYCIRLAKKAKGYTKTNPLVGAILVYNNEIIGEGWHTAFGQPHAEVEAVRSVSPENQYKIPKSTIYVTLEPCNHYGKTPPCTQLIIKSGIKKVVVGCLDPNPIMGGKSVSTMQENGIDVKVGVAEASCLELIRSFQTNIIHKRPHIILKWAQSRDGYIGQDKKQVWLSNELSGKLVHQWRSEVDGIFAGYNTIKTDNPRLTTRKVPGPNPVRISVDRNNSLNLDFYFFDSASNSIIFSPPTNRFYNLNHIKHIPQEDFKNNKSDWEFVFTRLYENNLGTIMIEGGAKVLQTLIHYGLWDEIRYIQTPKLLSKGISAPTLPEHDLKKIIQLEDNSIHILRQLSSGIDN